MVGTGSTIKGLVSLMIGLLVATIGLNNPAGVPRFTFGNVDLMGGIDFIAAMIGLFAVSEIFRYVLGMSPDTSNVQAPAGNLFTGWGKLFKQYWRQSLRGNVLGTAIGALPGAGADIAAWVSYAVSKRFSKTPEKFGTGHVEGIIESTSSNNAALGGAWVPALVFGIPGDSITAIVIGVLYLKGMNPGPTIFINNPQDIYAVFLIFILANIFMVPAGWAAIKSARLLMRVPRNVLMPTILLFCVVGSFAINNSVFGVTRDAGLRPAGLHHGGERLSHSADHPGDRAGAVAGGELRHVDDQVGRQLPGVLRTAPGGGSWRRDAGDLGGAAGHVPLAQGEG